MTTSYVIDTPAELKISKELVDVLGNHLRIGQIMTLDEPASPEIMTYVHMLLLANYPEMAWTMTLESRGAPTWKFLFISPTTNRVASIQRIK